MKRNIVFLILGAFFIKGWFYTTDGFRLGKITPGFPTNYQWSLYKNSFSDGEDQKGIREILGQKFTYLGRGQQCYVFESSDHKSVIKFVRTHKERYPFWTYLPINSQKRREVLKWKNSRIEKNAKSYDLAFQLLKEETGLIFAHLERTDDLKMEIEIEDPLGRVYHVDGDKMQFIIQRKMEPFLPYLHRCKKDRKAMEKAIDSLLDWVVMRARKGIRNKNRRCLKNLGIFDGNVVEIDVGEFRLKKELSDPKEFEEELIKSTKEFSKWLEKESPRHLPYFQQKLESAL